MKVFLAAAAALTLGSSALAYQTATVHFDPNVAIEVPATWSPEQRALYDQHILYYPTSWTAAERAAFEAMLDIPPAQWTPEQRTLWSTHYTTLPTTWTAAQRAAYQQQVAAWSTPWMMSHQTAMNTTTSYGAVPADRIVEPSNANPERDARGIRVISAAAVVPPGYNGIPGGAMGGPSEGGDMSYPACTATVTDNCIQLYERGVRASLDEWNRTHSTSMGVGGPIEGEDEVGDNTPEDDALDVDVEPDGDIDVDGDLDNDGDNDLE